MRCHAGKPDTYTENTPVRTEQGRRHRGGGEVGTSNYHI